MKEKLSLDDQQKKADVLFKLTEIKEKRQTLILEREKWEHEKIKVDSNVDKLRVIEDLITSIHIDPDKSLIGSEPAFKNAFSESELHVLKSKALEIVKRF